MPDWSCSLDDISTNDSCSGQGGLLTVFWIDQSDIDWDAMTNVLNWDDANYEVLNWIMLGGASWNEITFQRKNGRLDALYTLDNGFYEVSLLNLILNGHTAARTLTLGQAIPCCGIIAQVHDNNSFARVIGKEFIDGAWIDPLDPLRIDRHLDTHGAFGDRNDVARDEFDLKAQHSKPLPYSSLSVAEMRAL